MSMSYVTGIRRLDCLARHFVWKSSISNRSCVSNIFAYRNMSDSVSGESSLNKSQIAAASSTSEPKSGSNSRTSSPRGSPARRGYNYTMEGQSTAGIIVIGDEILKGQTLDTNSNFICKRLFSLGVKVKKISVICDEVDVIAAEVASFSKQFTHVITSGGIGPTHDDMTFEGVAKAFDVETDFHPQLVKVISDWFKTTDMDSPQMKMAKIPTTAKLIFGVDPATKKESKYPLVNVGNVFIFPGIPNLLERAFRMLDYLFKNPQMKFHTDELFVNKDEISIASIITQVAEKFKDEVVIGSYPNMLNSYYKVRLSLESTNPNRVSEAHKELCNLLPQGSVVMYDEDPIGSAADSVYKLVDSQESDNFSVLLRQAVRTLEESIDRYNLSDLCICFNGGKDCTVLLHLLYAVVKKKFPDHTDKLQALYIQNRSPFPEVEKFVQICRDSYNLEMIHYNGGIKECLATMKEKRPNIKATIMGTRRTDPFSSHLQDFSMTDGDWPQFMRINPMLDWDYQHVWTFLRQLSVPYCSLYDVGYTSLGSMDNTHPNPKLQYIDQRGILTYRPAYMLEDGGSERDGRNK